MENSKRIKRGVSNDHMEGRIIQSVDRAVKILLQFLEKERELALKDIAAGIDLPKPTVHSIVNTLVQNNLLEQNHENAKYRLGSVVFRLGIQYIRNKDFLSTVSVWAERLCYRFNLSVNVSMLIGNQAVVIYRVDPDHVIMTLPQVGSVMPIHCTCNGKILLAYTDRETRDTILKDYPFTKTTEKTITNREDFEKELEKIRANGIGFNNEEGILGIRAIGGPIFDHKGKILAAIGTTGYATFFNENEIKIINEVKLTCSSISRQLGFTGPVSEPEA